MKDSAFVTGMSTVSSTGIRTSVSSPSPERFRLLRNLDPVIPLLALSLTGIGLAYLSSAAPRSSYVLKQALFVLLGMIGYGAIVWIPYRKLFRYGHLAYAGGILALILVAIAGRRVNGAKSWFALGPVRLQPSEFVKIAMILFLAQFLSYYENYKKLGGLVLVLLILGIPFIMILKQPDLGTATALLPMFFAMIWVAGARKRHLALVGVGGLLLAVVGYTFVLRGYQKMRIEAWLHPDRYSDTFSYQNNQAKISIGSGQVTGKGWGQGTHHKLKYLPERHTDFIFAVISEEGGFVMSSLTIVLYAALFGYGLLIALTTSDATGKTIAVGAVALIMGQAMINLSVSTGIMPTTGIALPMLSYGGSSTVSTWMALGLLSNVAARRTMSVH